MVADAIYQSEYTEKLCFVLQELGSGNQQKEKHTSLRGVKDYYQSVFTKANKGASA